MRYVIKRNGTKEEFDPEKIEAAILKAFKSCGVEPSGRDNQHLAGFLSELSESK